MNRTQAIAVAVAVAAAWLLGAASTAPPPACESAGASGDDPPLDFLFASQDDWRRIELEQALAQAQPAGR